MKGKLLATVTILLLLMLTPDLFSQNNIGAQTPSSTQKQTQIPIAATTVSKYTHEEERIQNTYDDARPSWNPQSGGSSSTSGGNGGIYTYTDFLGVYGIVDYSYMNPTKWNIKVSGNDLSFTYDNAQLSKYNASKYGLQIQVYYSRNLIPFNDFGITNANYLPIIVEGAMLGGLELPQIYNITTAPEADVGSFNFTFSLKNLDPSGTTTIKLTTDSFKYGINPTPLQAPDWLGNPHIESYETQIHVIVSGYIVPIEDLEVKLVEPVQVVFGASAMVKDKPAVIRAQIKNTFTEDIEFKIKITVNGKDFDNTKIIPKLTTEYYYLFPTGKVFFDCTGKSTVSVEIVSAHSTTDPSELLPDANATNNQKHIEVKVKDTQGFSILYAFLKSPIDTTFSLEATSFIKATYPISPNKVSYREAKFDYIDPNCTDANRSYTSSYNSYSVIQKLKTVGVFSTDTYVVGVVDPKYLQAGICGFTYPDAHFTVVSSLSYPYNPAHEIGHRSGLYGNGQEEYKIIKPGYPASGYWVEKDIKIDPTRFTCFMGYYTNDMWIDETCYNNLLQKRNGGVDPELLYVSGYLSNNGSLSLPAWYYIPNGIADVEPGASGDYSIICSDKNGLNLCIIQFNITSAEGLNNNMTDGTGFAFTTPFVNETSKVTIMQGNKVLGYRIVSAHSPIVKITAPNVGEIIGGSNARITWSASDSDGDRLTYVVLFSDDNGNKWLPIATDLDQTSFAWDTTGIANSTQCLIRVVASDGYNTAEDTSDSMFTLDSNGNIPVAPLGTFSDYTVFLWVATCVTSAICVLSGIFYFRKRRQLKGGAPIITSPTHTRICNNCYAINRASAKFCKNCGKGLS